MKVVCCWTDISGYMAACWRAIHQVPEIDFHLIAYSPSPEATHVDFDPALLGDISFDLLDNSRRNDPHWLADRISSLQPEIIVLPGWIDPSYRKLVEEPKLNRVKFMMAMDTPWQGTVRQRLARYAMRSYLRHIDLVMVCGERSWQFARALGFPEGQIRRGVYSVDTEQLESAFAQRLEHTKGWPRSFLFVGRYIDIKGIDVLIDAYQTYRRNVDEPWPLHCCGMGPLAKDLAAVEGIVDQGFVQPNDLLNIRAQHGVFVLPSRFDPWPLAIVEACASGSPVICTDACGSSVENVRPFYNGLIIPPGDSSSLYQALQWCHENVDQLPEMGRRSQQLAAAYSPQMWVARWQAAFNDLLAQL